MLWGIYMEQMITESFVVEKIKEFLINKENGNWHEDKVKEAKLHGHGVDIILIGGKRNSEYFFIECKGKSYSKSAKSVNKEGWLNALGQIITRMTTSRVIKSGERKGEPNRAYKYGLGLCKEGAEVALKRIPKEIAKTLNLYMFSVDDNGVVEMFSPSQFLKENKK